jgi:N-acetylmuramoyl-L-alanine amidase
MNNGKYVGVIDPGHALGSDKHGCNGFSEATHNFAMAQALKAKLEATGKFTIILTHNDLNTDPSLGTRGRMVKTPNGLADFFLSMHTNGSAAASSGGKARGVTIFYSVDLPENKSVAIKLGKAIAAAMGTSYRGAVTRAGGTVSKPDPSTAEDYYTVIDSSQDAGCKLVLLSESGFHDNLQDWAAMSTPAGIDAIAAAHAKVLQEYFNAGSVVTPPPVQDDYIEYVYAKGDYLGAIGKRFGVDWRKIKYKRNGEFVDQYRMRIGDELLIPRNPAKPVVTYFEHVFDGPNESLWSLGKKYNIDWTLIKRKDGKPLDARAMRDGMVLLIPKV